MNERDERRVIEALRALTGGLTVPEEDIITAGGRLRDRLEPTPPRRRLPLVAAAGAALLVVIGYVALHAIDRDGNAAPPVNRPPHSPADDLKAAVDADAYALPAARFTAGGRSTSRDLAGLWLLRAPFSAVMFVEGNGDWRGDSPTGTAAFGTSALARDTLTRVLDDRSGCARSNHLVGSSTSWRAALARDGSLRLQLKDAPGTCTPADDREVWDRVDPGSPVAQYLLATAQDAEWQAAPERLAWQGLYVAPETGHVLEVGSNGRYRYYHALPASLVASDRGWLESQPGEMSGTCTGGAFSGTLEVARLPGENGYVFPHDAIRITTTTTGCVSGVAEDEVWVDLSS